MFSTKLTCSHPHTRADDQNWSQPMYETRLLFWDNARWVSDTFRHSVTWLWRRCRCLSDSRMRRVAMPCPHCCVQSLFLPEASQSCQCQSDHQARQGFRSSNVLWLPDRHVLWFPQSKACDYRIIYLLKWKQIKNIYLKTNLAHIGWPSKSFIWFLSLYSWILASLISFLTSSSSTLGRLT